jgi:hypothetical protein
MVCKREGGKFHSFLNVAHKGMQVLHFNIGQLKPIELKADRYQKDKE